MATVTPTRRYTPEELDQMDDEGVGYELNDDGELEERAVSNDSSEIAGELLGHLRDFVRAGGARGRLYLPDVIMRFWPEQPRRSRRPDLAFVAEERAPKRWQRPGFLEVAPDLIVEVISPGENAQQLQTKLREYRAGGVRLVWVIYPETRSALVVRLDGTANEMGPDELLDGEDVLPGFSVRIRDLFFE